MISNPSAIAIFHKNQAPTVTKYFFENVLKLKIWPVDFIEITFYISQSLIKLSKTIYNDHLKIFVTC